MQFISELPLKQQEEYHNYRKNVRRICRLIAFYVCYRLISFWMHSDVFNTSVQLDGLGSTLVLYFPQYVCVAVVFAMVYPMTLLFISSPLMSLKSKRMFRQN